MYRSSRGTRRRRRAATILITLFALTIPASAGAAEIGRVEVDDHPRGVDCRSWGQAAVRNWLTGRCAPPAGAPTYLTYLPGGGGTWLRGLSGSDGCTKAPDVPLGRYNFRPACDMHDYGFWLMDRGTLKKSQYNLDVINAWFTTVLEYGVCGSFSGLDRSTCRRIARQYGYGVAVAGPWVAQVAQTLVEDIPIGPARPARGGEVWEMVPARP